MPGRIFKRQLSKCRYTLFSLRGGIGAVEADNVVVLIFHPDAADKAAIPRALLGLYIDDDAAHFAQKFAAHEGEVVVLALEVLIEHHHLRETQRQELHGEDLGQIGE